MRSARSAGEREGTQALRGTMLELIDRGESGSATSGRRFAYAHPMFWAPFSLVGDGGR